MATNATATRHEAEWRQTSHHAASRPPRSRSRRNESRQAAPSHDHRPRPGAGAAAPPGAAGPATAGSGTKAPGPPRPVNGPGATGQTSNLAHGCFFSGGSLKAPVSRRTPGRHYKHIRGAVNPTSLRPATPRPRRDAGAPDRLRSRPFAVAPPRNHAPRRLRHVMRSRPPLVLSILALSNNADFGHLLIPPARNHRISGTGVFRPGFDLTTR